ncbi:MAG: toll/interleukin-1 receptor domain-containing protein [Deltaproteobacteria bacterium]|nr:toll/interleukin-1 receptor domain-containing protein [Deltaproteobacteria bacterium]
MGRRRRVYISSNLTPRDGLMAFTFGVSLIAALLFRQKMDMDSPQRLTASTHDVFISYSRTPAENLEWVSKHVVSQLEKAGLGVWFDKKSLFLGTSWYEKIAQGIQGSRYFIPIYSADCFKKDFCRVELELAAIRRAHETAFILPLARVKTDIPPGYQHINFIDVNERPDFINVVLEAVKTSAKPD